MDKEKLKPWQVVLCFIVGPHPTCEWRCVWYEHQVFRHLQLYYNRGWTTFRGALRFATLNPQGIGCTKGTWKFYGGLSSERRVIKELPGHSPTLINFESGLIIPLSKVGLCIDMDFPIHDPELIDQMIP